MALIVDTVPAAVGNELELVAGNKAVRGVADALHARQCHFPLHDAGERRIQVQEQDALRHGAVLHGDQRLSAQVQSVDAVKGKLRRMRKPRGRARPVLQVDDGNAAAVIGDQEPRAPGQGHGCLWRSQLAGSHKRLQRRAGVRPDPVHAAADSVGHVERAIRGQRHVAERVLVAIAKLVALPDAAGPEIDLQHCRAASILRLKWR